MVTTTASAKTNVIKTKTTATKANVVKVAKPKPVKALKVKCDHTPNEFKLFEVVVEHSLADNWEEAVCEWDVKGLEYCKGWTIDDVFGGNTCACGKKDLYYLYTIQNRHTFEIIDPIGSTCIKKFGQKHMDDTVKLANMMDNKLTEGRFKGNSYGYLCKNRSSYIEFVRNNGKKTKYAKLVKYYDFWKTSQSKLKLT